ncbi:MAG TPA: hypothetical protein VJ841_04760 [Candidatus Saccharimonadales bacterium]|nr:hypothetical protein [Candidatus Saccharimonadales bacterium]
MVKLAPSKNPEKESKQFATVSLIFGIISLLIGFLGIVALATGVRGIVLSQRVKNKQYLTFSIIGTVLGLIAFIYMLLVVWQ